MARIALNGEVEGVTVVTVLKPTSELGLDRALSKWLPLLQLLLLPVDALVRDGTPPEPLLFKLPRLMLPAGLLPMVLLKHTAEGWERRRGGRGPVA
jgi:hypothetical protein